MNMVEYLTSNMWQLWAVLAVLGLILELTSGDFFIICLAIGAAGAALIAPFANIYWQLGVFAVVSLFSLLMVRPPVLRYLHRNDENRVSNADALLGRKGRVSETIPASGFGYVAIDGDQWRAVTPGDEEISVGTRVKVIGRESIIITVEKDEEAQ
jgi:membrane protein implicated in regulation of membrane protease activity